ncbi:transposase IS66 [Companilactobacillus futsaii JCM 17355]|uniref:Transposase IS66 n=1 Tax=Companilactobacillus futsaii JCM 17355 TaxID=1423818 RepID=A0ABR5P304_9LACO|nr:transposase IS66 [Companilactobacillus futsaii JCM 17355]
MIKLAEFLMPVYNELRYRLLSYKELQGDETPFQVLREDGKSPTSKSYIWLVTTPRKLSEQVVYYAYSPTRSGTFAQKLYQGFHGVLQCDGYSGYNLLGDCIERTGCWAHVRRKFYDAFKSHVKDAEMPLKFLNRMFKLEREWQPLSPKARRKRRRGQLKKVVNRFWKLLEQIETLPNSRLGKAIAYAQSQKVYFRILNNGVIDWSNNTSERNMKTFVIGRKNWLFSTSTKGAKANAIWMTIVESAKANHLDPRQYIMKLLEKLPTLPAFPKKEDLATYLPWNQDFNQALEA